eukprot:m.675727 g.675727  ORF g.675727 m.675727 type:complete len:130 (+) comp58554_c0_seq30:794-1183(+)
MHVETTCCKIPERSSSRSCESLPLNEELVDAESSALFNFFRKFWVNWKHSGLCESYKIQVERASVALAIICRKQRSVLRSAQAKLWAVTKVRRVAIKMDCNKRDLLPLVGFHLELRRILLTVGFLDMLV